MQEDIRWRQRLENYSRALSHLKRAVQIKEADIIVQAAVIQFFEVAFELAWKTIKDYLQEEGFADVNSPRATLKKAFETGLISDGQTWLEALQKRNTTVHTYDEKSAEIIYHLICDIYYPLMEVLYRDLEKL